MNTANPSNTTNESRGIIFSSSIWWKSGITVFSIKSGTLSLDSKALNIINLDGTVHKNIPLHSISKVTHNNSVIKIYSSGKTLTLTLYNPRDFLGGGLFVATSPILGAKSGEGIMDKMSNKIPLGEDWIRHLKQNGVTTEDKGSESLSTYTKLYKRILPLIYVLLLISVIYVVFTMVLLVLF
jgi:hypothetical protein